MATLWFKNMMDDLTKVASPSKAEFERAAIAFFKKLAADVDQPRQIDRTHFDEDIAFNLEECRKRIAEIDDQLITGNFDRKIILASNVISEEAAASPALPQVQDDRLACQLAARAEREQNNLLIHLLTRPAMQYHAEDALFAEDRRHLDAPRSSPPIAVPVQPLDALVADYLRRKSAQRVTASTIEETRRALGWLCESFESVTSITAIRKDELAAFRDDLARLNVRLRGRSVPFEARLTDEDDQQVASNTASRYWRSVQSFFAWATEDGHLPADPAASLRLRTKRGETARTPPPFSEGELRRLFSTPLYAGYRSRDRLSTPGNLHLRFGHWWSVVLLMHTGLRAGELVQLLPEDFVFDADIPHIRVRTQDDHGKFVKTTKNASAIRNVPVVPVLLDLGLREFVTARARQNKRQRVLRDFTGGHRESDGLTKFWSRYLPKFGLYQPGRSTHVWRHTVIACLRANDVAEEDIQAVVGHKRGTITAGYGGEYPLSRKRAALSRLDYGFDVLACLGGPYDKTKHG